MKQHDEFSLREGHLEKLLERAFKNLAANDRAAAALDFESALALDPDNPMAAAFVAATKASRGEIDEAERLARHAVELAPQLPFTHYLLATALLGKQNIDGAEAVMWEGVAANQRDPFLRLELGRLLIARGHYDEASRQLKTAVEVAPDNPEALFLDGLVCAVKSCEADAIKSLERAIELDPKHQRAMALLGALHMGRAYRMLTTPPKLDEYRRAAGYLSRAFEIDPNDQFVSERLQIVEETIGRISQPPDRSRVPNSNWFVDLMKFMGWYVGSSMLWVALTTLLSTSSSRGEDLLTGLSILAVMELGAFCLIMYLKKDFSALAPSIFDLKERMFSTSERESKEQS